ncbi:MAG: pilus assembly protein PilY [Burkholderiaceae bacterium]|nr:pilus assembly protein PilY [Burkholderiaceae bacterium]
MRPTPPPAAAALLALLALPVSTQSLTLAEAPLFLTSSIKPNVLVIYDNSQSMDNTMPGSVYTTFADPNTRGNIARDVLRETITTYRGSFRWGLEHFEALGTPYLHDYRPWYNFTLYYAADMTGLGRVVQPVQDDSTTHYNRLMTLLATQTADATTAEIKNSGYGTPLAGSVLTAARYYGNELSTGTPITDKTCQKNYVVLATDGIPNVGVNNNRYTAFTDLVSTKNTDGSWNFSPAMREVFREIGGLRATRIDNHASLNGTYDIPTYVVAMGSVAEDEAAVAGMHEMARVGGTGQAFLATDRAALRAAFATIGSNIVARSAAAGAVSMNTGSWRSGSMLYQGRFASGDWSGQLLAYAIGADGNPAATATWDASQRLNAQHWDTGRRILTYKPSAALGARGVALRWPANPATPGASEIDTGLVAALNTNAAGTVDGFGAQRLAWLRGDTSREERNCSGCAAPVFRGRSTTVLGDIVNSAPVYFDGGGAYVRDGAEASAYSAYKATRRGKKALVFVGANDGMLHAFDAATGDEVFAYVPWAVASRLSALTEPLYAHRYTVDGTVAVGDVYYNNAWHSLLVGPMGAGGKGLYALDVSDPATMDESHAANIVRWETGSDADIGHIFAPPVLAKMKNGRWMAISGNGYNSSNGRAVLLLIDVETGAVTKIDTLSGSSTAPNGLSGVVAVSSANNGVSDLVYAGDLAGNLWKFDLSSTATSGWKVAYGSATTPAPLFATGGRPITARPDVSVHPEGGYMLVFGTGRYLATGDGATTAAQALYGVRDAGAVVSSTQLVTQSVLGTANGSDGRRYRLTTHAVGSSGGSSYTGDNTVTTSSFSADKRGWVLALPSSGERIVSQAAVRYGKVVVSTLIPGESVGTSDPCVGSGNGWVMEVSLYTGNRPTLPSLDSNGDNDVTAADALTYSGGSAYASGVQVGSLPASPGFIRARNRALDDKLVNTSSGSVLRVREAGSTATSGRVSWEQLQ